MNADKRIGFGAEPESFGFGGGGEGGAASGLGRLGYLRAAAGMAVPDAVPGPRAAGLFDATGVGAPVLDLLRRAGLGCGIEGVILTGGERESHAGRIWHVPKRDLITGLRVLLDDRELGLPAQFGPDTRPDGGVARMETPMNAGGAVRVGAWREVRAG